jgi:hypothetical protein
VHVRVVVFHRFNPIACSGGERHSASCQAFPVSDAAINIRTRRRFNRKRDLGRCRADITKAFECDLHICHRWPCLFGACVPTRAQRFQ